MRAREYVRGVPLRVKGRRARETPFMVCLEVARKSGFPSWCEACIVAQPIMRPLPRALLLGAGLHLAAVTTPGLAWAQARQAPQPVPYPTLPAPVPYGQPAPGPAPLPSARGPAVGQDVIYMKNGGILRGTIIDAIPNSQARIQLATGEIATVPWQEIARIEHGDARGPLPGPPLPAPGGGLTPPPPVPGPGEPRPAPPSSVTVWVHLDGPDDARLQQYTNDWQTVCAAPCDVQLPIAPDYRIEGGGLKDSGVFKLNGNQGDHVTVSVNGASKAWFVIGIVITPIGGLFTLVGSVIGLAGSVAAAASRGSGVSDANSVAVAGWTTFAFGAAALVGGILLIVNNSKTTTTQDLAAPPQTGLLQTDAWKRVPTWREAPPEQRALPPVVGVPLWSGRF